MGAYELTLGPFLIASWANAMLWTIEMKQALRFFVTYKHDGPLLRIMVAGLLLVDSFGSITVFANAYLYSVAHWGDVSYLTTDKLCLPLIVITASISTVTLHSFLNLRVYRLSKSILLAGVLQTIAVGAFASGIECGVRQIQFPSIADRSIILTRVTIWTASSAGVDVTIAVVLVILLQKVKKKSNKFGQWQVLTRPLRMLSLAAVQSGGVSAVWTLLGLIIFSRNTSSNVGPGIAFLHGRISGMTLLYNLNLRKATARSIMTHDGQMDGGSSSKSGENPKVSIFSKLRNPSKAARSQEGQNFALGVAVTTIVETVDERGEDVHVTLQATPSPRYPPRTKSDRVIFEEFEARDASHAV